MTPPPQKSSRPHYGGSEGRARLLGGSLPMVWIALAACGASLLFGLLALLHHG